MGRNRSLGTRERMRFQLTSSFPRVGKLLKQFGPRRIPWGTDSTWYGSPQFLIDAFRSFAIPESMQHEFGYPALTPEVKDWILSASAAELYRIDINDVASRLAGRSANGPLQDGAGLPLLT
jgi:hypothetical protein